MELKELVDKHPKPSMAVAYGTAGFRFEARLLPSTVCRVGILASLRSKYLNGQAIGVMITASHNPPIDNGVKLIDPQGEMLESSWEVYATEFANAKNEAELKKTIDTVVESLKIDLTKPAKVVYARDSRDSGPMLVSALVDGLSFYNSTTTATDYGLLTTPQLHYIVKCLNTDGEYGTPTEQGYYEKLSSAYKKILSAYPNSNYSITIDTANGVGGPKLHDLAKYLGDLVRIKVVNDKYLEPELLNSNCGADYVKTNQKLPNGIETEPLNLYASFDGDADRIVFFFINQQGQFKLLDGDKIATLIAAFLAELTAKCDADLNIGVVQTAYANGSSTAYIEDQLKLPVACTPTGVKHLHHAAKNYDIGVYFEANGHGTVLFDDTVDNKLQGNIKAESLLALRDVINQTVGDSISDLLLVLIILTIKQWSPSDWDDCYTDLPNKLEKVEVKDRTMFKTTDAERKLVSPENLQPKIDQQVATVKQGRSFVRASGTENVVRVYAEAATKDQVDELIQTVKKLVEQYQ